MAIWLGLFLFLCAVIGMAAFAYAVHRRSTLGFGWVLHDSHRRARHCNREWDLYAAIFAVPSFTMLLAAPVRRRVVTSQAAES
ncbi:hypothetical protein HMP09_2443 [Sphingomonas sp. HMP9]|uniref:hypothetical protein n=1 Tax=Sphingomonas sp. HMP9 TaxID=1517554 RepID=UPI0015967255|nr:hypothetical protein [Sphingomonas sp. HMP9]BCA63209.1 hypothetical protein HMP09_2443 [Sphingomonas sp. HMP9]